MIEALRLRAAHRDLRAALAARQPRPLPPDPRQRTALVLLPTEDRALRETWALIDRLDLPDRLLIPVHVGDQIGYAPDRFAGAVRGIGSDEHDWRRLPSRSARSSIWTQRPDLALNLAAPSDLGAALLAGASPAAVRIGIHDPEREACYDLMVGPEADPAATVATVERLLRRLDPPLVPFR